MEIAILTMPLRTNYGAILQNYALQQTLKRLGHTPYTLDSSRLIAYPVWKYPIKDVKRQLKALMGKGTRQPLCYEMRYLQDYKIFAKHTRDFVAKHIRTYPYKNLYKELTSQSFGAYVVGSDQVWRPEYNDLRQMFLDFTEGWPVRRVAYAASFGKEEWLVSENEAHEYRRLIADFDAISVREASGVEICRRHLGVEAIHIADPTILLPCADYESLADQAQTKRANGGLFFHILDRDKEKSSLVERLAAKYSSTPFSVNQKHIENDLSTPIADRIQPPVEDWLDAFRKADYVVTDSFHATVFAIMFNKRFLVAANPERGEERLRSLLGDFGLERCLISEGREPTFPEIDYDTVNQRLATLREQGIRFLTNAL